MAIGPFQVIDAAPLLPRIGGLAFGQFYPVTAGTRAGVKQFVASHPYRAAGFWRQMLVRPLRPDRQIG